MAIATRQVEVDWLGPLEQGVGTLSPGSRAFDPVTVTWASRTEHPDHKTSPEELLAGAHASCFAMALSLVLGKNKTPPERLIVAAACTLDEVGGAPKITTMHLNVRAWVAELQTDAFEGLVEQAAKLCPLSNALRGNVQISVESSLEEGEPGTAGIA